MVSAVIGSLRVDLGLNSAKFSNGLKTAQGDLNRFRSVAIKVGSAIGAAFSGVAVARAIRGAADYADNVGKIAQRAGVTTEALSRLGHAAKFSDIGIEQLGDGLQKLNRSMVEAAQNSKSQAATAFAALGVSVKDSAGNLRDSDAVFSDIAGRFALLENGAAKTALSMTLFGKSGAALIPVLNEGADGLQRYSDESDRFGLTVSGKTARAADDFGDTMERAGDILHGVTMRMMEAALPALQRFADTLASPQFQTAAMTLATNVIGALDSITQAIAGVINMLGDLGKKLSEALAPAGARGSNMSSADIEKEIDAWQSDVDQTYSKIARNRALNEIAALRTELGRRAAAEQTGADGLGAAPSGFDFRGWINDKDKAAAAGSTPDLSEYLADVQQTAAATKALNAEQQMWANLTSELSPLLEGMRDPFAQLQTDLDKLGAWLQHEGADGWDQFAAAAQRATAGMVSGVAGLAGEALGAMSQIFEGNKAIAAAMAVVNGIGSIAKTLETYGVTPWGIAAAGVAAATAAANVASILSASETTRSMPGTTGALGGMSAPAQQSQSVYFNIKGSGSVSTDDIVEQMTKQIADGGYGGLIKVMREA